MDKQDDERVSPAAIQEFLGGVDYPAKKSELMNHAKSQGAPEEVLNTLNKLPDQEYKSPIGVTEEIGKIE